jgi:hypothetical protein
MDVAVPTALVMDYQRHIEAVALPDPDDRHNVAAGIAAEASFVLTWNLKDFPAKELRKHGLRRLTPDGYLVDLYDRVPDLIVGSLANARRNLTKTRVSASEFVGIMKNQGLHQLAKRIQTRMTDL